METRSYNWIFTGITVLLVLIFVLPLVGEDLFIIIDVAPNVLNLGSQGEVVTVHTNLPYSQVVGATVSLNGAEISYWKSDNRGYFVAKFQMQDIKNLPLDVGAYNTLTLAGLTVNQDTFFGSQDIMVVKNIPRGK